MIPRDKRYCAKGVTLWWMRRCVRNELADNPRFLAFVTAALEEDYVKRLHAIKLIGMRYDVLLEVETPQTEEGRIRIDIQIDDVAEPDTYDKYWRKESIVAWASGGASARCMTFAPEIWFARAHSRRPADRRITFEAALDVGTPAFTSVLTAGIERAQRQLHRPNKPRQRVPYWVYASAR